MTCLKVKLCALVTKWNRFWFDPIDLYNVGLFRMLLGFVLLSMYWLRFQNIEMFYYNGGLLNSSAALDIVPDYFRTSFPVFFNSDAGIYNAHLAYLVLLFLFAIGIIGRWGTWILTLLSLGFMQRNFPLVYGADLFAHFWLFYLSFVKHNTHWSVLNLKNGWRPSTRPQVDSDLLSTAFVRLLQIQMCLSYAYTGLEKFKGTQWWEGSAVWYVVGMQDLVSVDLSFIRHIPVLIAILSMSTVIFEVYFIFAVWNKSLRKYWLALGFFFHLGTAVLMSLWYFFLVMVLPYLLFLDTRKMRARIAAILLKFSPQS